MNARANRQAHQGVLIQVGGGYGCINPWPELGDAPLDEQLDLLKNGGSSPLVCSALHCAQVDACARQKNRSLFEGVTVPRSHATLPMDEDSFVAALAAGFERVKVKMGKNLEQESEFVAAMAEKYPALRWRMDFNHTQSASEIQNVLGSWSEALLQQIDFLEDAFAVGETDAEQCLQASIPQALDRQVSSPPGDFPVWVIKPAINQVAPLLKEASDQKKRVVVTSYMDHPLGQSYAAWQAGAAAEQYPGLLEDGGLITHGLFEPDHFSEALGEPSPSFYPASGTGLGFDSLLEQLPWTRLI